MDSVLNCMVTDRLATGEFSERLAKLAKEKLHFDFGVTLRSPAAALALALECLSLPAGSHVALSALAEPWALKVIRSMGFEPVWLDVDAGTACFSPAALDSLAGSGARALYLAHPWGIMIDPALLVEIGIPIIEDISTALGAAIDIGLPGEGGDAAGSVAVAAEPAGGEAGAVDEAAAAEQAARLVAAGSLGLFTILGLEDSQAITAGGGALLYARARRDGQALRNQAEKLVATDLLPDLNAALALTQLRDADRFQEKRAELYKLYEQSLLRSHKKALMSTRDGRPAYYGCVVVLEAGIKDVRAYAKKKEVDTLLAFEGSCVALGLVPEGACPTAASLANRALAFPLHPRLGKTAAQKIAKVLVTLP
ncbi:MAG: hypothetical protein A2087_01730 [Spirochaetes bacterium GWD1_61_31]|nr:MAG: hypothetical protein A2Y37_10095 [Spirochaetes bacterium GWB1_60_80]OHD29092.1 MAG: hypothetical protein A2004_14545 [Spirochaetes bacterium GWC1_61_12]OHD35918.1 MAG: hypothetical protein A2087_01730 [Spirochaetes bacterium GWD1_61_31]OHD44271.1 MAG: hypothetical protein A2Y35_06750 [Spirochaetes bacterium GWE1_60_18]OHD60446.1 MAG: hypothetical protein A2Y32_00775 [Spirochaetes bacterium GWF1_60_12]